MSTLLGFRDELGQLQQRGEILKEEYSQEHFSRNRAPGRKDRHRKGKQKGCQVFPYFLSSQISHLKKKHSLLLFNGALSLRYIYSSFSLGNHPL